MAAVALAGMIYASWTDIKKREVPNRISFSLIGLMIFLRLIYSAQLGDFNFFWTAIAVGLGFLAMGLAFFYAQQWGGADIKLLVILGLGFAVLPPEFNPMYLAKWPFFLTLLINFFIVSVVWSLAYSIDMGFQNPNVFKDFRASLDRIEMIAIFFGSTLAVASGFYYETLWMLLAIPAFWVLVKFLKAVEKNCMYKTIAVDHLVEFDVPEEDVKVDGKTIVSRTDPNGITPEQIKKLKKLADKGKIPEIIEIKWGIPLIPVFPITLVISLFVGDLFLFFLSFV